MFGKRKVAAQDFNMNQLPKNRYESFWDCIKNRFNVILNSGFLLLLFSVPLLFVINFSNLLIYETNLALKEGYITSHDAAIRIFDISNWTNLLTILALMILAVGLSGVIRVYRQLIWQEGIFFWSDFIGGIKSDALHNVLIFMLVGCLNYLMQYTIRFGYFNTDSLALTFAISLSIAAFVVGVLILFFFVFQTVLYQLSFIAKIKNAFLFLGKHALSNFIVLILMAAPWALLFVPHQIFYLIISVVLFLLILPLEVLIIMEYCFHIFDLYINKEHYPTIYRKGMWQA